MKNYAIVLDELRVTGCVRLQCYTQYICRDDALLSCTHDSCSLAEICHMCYHVLVFTELLHILNCLFVQFCSMKSIVNQFFRDSSQYLDMRGSMFTEWSLFFSTVLLHCSLFCFSLNAVCSSLLCSLL